MYQKRFLTALIVIIVLAVGVSVFRHQDTSGQKNGATMAKSSSKSAKPTQATPKDSFDKTQHSLTDPTSIWVIVNKSRPLQPKNYAPADLVFPDLPQRVPGNESMKMRKPAADAATQMFAAAKKAGLQLEISSAYRSYTFQVSLYGGYVKTQGQAVADTQSARPGYSEHQTGLAFDIEPVGGNCHLQDCFGDIPEGKWLVANAYKYGFLLRYPKDGQPITGYIYEPWHFRYIGVDLATEMHTQGVETLEQFFGLPSAPDYN